MATIITVHGTNTTGPEEGDSWWQKGSEFERDIRELVESEDGELKFEPHVWDGANSESSRRKAGERLYRKILGLEDSHESYCLVGHSHGGSVISNALLKASAKKNPLEYLKKWITIGTPFIFTRKNFLLFSRLNFIGKAAYVTLITYTLIMALTIYSNIRINVREGEAPHGTTELVLLIAMCSMPLILYYIIMIFINSKSLYTNRKKNIKYSDKHFAGRWFSLWHKNDEAIQGLRSVKSLNFNIFAKDFSVPAFLFLSLFIFPLMFLYLIFSQAFITWFDIVTGAGHLVGGGQDIFENVGFVANTTNSFILNLFRQIFGHPFGVSTQTDHLFGIMTVSIIIVPLLLFVLSLVLMFFVKTLAIYLSRLLSRISNSLTWSQIRKSAYGDDAIGDRSLDAQYSPMWMSKTSPPLPESLGNEILSFSNQEAAKSLPKFRDAINQLAFSESEGSKSDVISEYLTWNELIHTAYFSLPRFRKLVAFAIAQSEGFRATNQFKNDPDHELVGKWYDEIGANEEPALQGAG